MSPDPPSGAPVRQPPPPPMPPPPPVVRRGAARRVKTEAKTINQWLFVLGAASVILVIIGLLKPAAASRIGLWIMVGAALLAAGLGLYRFAGRVRPLEDSAFEPDEEEEPSVSRRLQSLLPDSSHSDGRLSHGATYAVSSVARNKLLANRGLSLSTAEHHPQIQAIVSPLLWSVINPGLDLGGRKKELPKYHQLNVLLHELEQI